MKKKYKYLGIATAVLAGAGISFLLLKNKEPQNPPPVAEYVDLQKYLGKWYDVAHYPMRFQKNCTGSQANYSLKENGDIEVYNSCFKNSLDGKLKDIKGKAWVVDKQTNAKLKVQFFWPLASDYWIHEVAEDYSWAIVGNADRSSLWILSRTSKMDGSILDMVLAKIEALGYDTGKLKWEEQPA